MPTGEDFTPVINPQARQYLETAIQALNHNNFTSAERDLGYACEEWPDHCDLHRAMAFSHTMRDGARTTTADTTAIRNALSTFDEMVTAIGGDAEESFTTLWDLPMVPIILPLKTRGQVRSAYAAVLVESGRYDEARDELDAAIRERVTRPDNANATAKVIAAVECLLYYRTQRWAGVINCSATLCAAQNNSDIEQVSMALGNAFAGTALAHLGSHNAGQEKLRYAISMNFSAVSAWASLQLGLSHRTAGDEESAQKALASGMQFSTMPELSDAIRDKTTKMRISAPDVIDARTSYWDPASEPDMADFQRQSSQDDRRHVLAEAMRELDALDGMDSIKEQTHTLSHAISFENEQRRRGMAVKPKTRHLIFKGPPGTGKTTIANLIVRLYYGLGVIRTHNLVHANRATLIGSVEGQSAEKTMAKLNEARGGVLFVDEAYELVQDRPGQSDPYGSEALTTLLEYMDNNRDDIIIIIAGYEAPIERFLVENPGLKSRFAHSLSFNTYTGDEMWRILTGMGVKEGRVVDESIEDKFKQIIEVMWDTDQRGERVLDVAGNGRFARNVFEQAQELASKRLISGGSDLSSLSDEEFMYLAGDDVLGAMANILKGFGINNVV